MKQSLILVVEDEAVTVDMIRTALLAKDYLVAYAGTVSEGWRMAETLRPALVIVDMGLPDAPGVDLCRRIRAHPVLRETPVIILTGKKGLEDKEKGFEAGADHYLVKPFAIQELHLWVEALLRRVGSADEKEGILRAEDFAIDPQTRRIETAGRVIENLTPKEFELLYALVRQSPKVLSKDALIAKVWKQVLRDNTIEVHVRNLRAKLGDAAKRIVTVPGVGYRFL